MARRGTKPQPDAWKVLKGTFEPSRAGEQVVKPLQGEAIAPKWLKGRARRLWDEKLAVYARRGQTVVGCEGALAQYCSLEAELIDGYTRKVEIPVAKVNAFRIFANEFYDTPASQHAPAKRTTNNRFAANGQRPA